MAENPSNGSLRLDSWKAIAAYLGRDERTVQRWERKLGLPVRRLPGGRGTSVFAYAAELDAWLAANQPAANHITADAQTEEPHAAGKPWRVCLYVDERGTALQQQALTEIFSGRVGGPRCATLP